jgi:biopolymer transport protein ExbD
MDDQPIDTLNVIPFVDIMLVLLTIVLTTASFIATGRIPVALPETAHAETGKQKARMIELTVDGGIHYEGEAVSKETLTERARDLPPDTSFLVRADRAIRFQQFVDVADVLRQLKFNKVAIQTRNAGK